MDDHKIRRFKMKTFMMKSKDNGIYARSIVCFFREIMEADFDFIF